MGFIKRSREISLPISGGEWGLKGTGMQAQADTLSSMDRLPEAKRYRSVALALHLASVFAHLTFAAEFAVFGSWIASLLGIATAIAFLVGYRLSMLGRHEHAFLIPAIIMPTHSIAVGLIAGFPSMIHLFALSAPLFIVANPFWSRAQKLSSIMMILFMYALMVYVLFTEGPFFPLTESQMEVARVFHLFLFFTLVPVLLFSYARNAPNYQRVVGEALSLAATQQLARTVAHEIRQPLAALKMSLDLEMLGKLPSKGKEREKQIELVRSQVERIERLVQRLLEITDLRSIPYPADGPIYDLDSSRAPHKHAEDEEGADKPDR
jgi:signal transduction histidine kinase